MRIEVLYGLCIIIPGVYTLFIPCSNFTDFEILYQQYIQLLALFISNASVVAVVVPSRADKDSSHLYPNLLLTIAPSPKQHHNAVLHPNSGVSRHNCHLSLHKYHSTQPRCRNPATTCNLARPRRRLRTQRSRRSRPPRKHHQPRHPRAHNPTRRRRQQRPPSHLPRQRHRASRNSLRPNPPGPNPPLSTLSQRARLLARRPVPPRLHRALQQSPRPQPRHLRQPA